MFESLDEIKEKYPINFEEELKKYEKEILSIFNSTKLNIDDYDLNNSCILFIIGLYYYNVLKDNQSTEIFYLLATRKNNCDAIVALAYFYKNKDNKESMLKYFLMAVECDCYNLDILYYIGQHYQSKTEYKLMIKYYSMGAECGDLRSINNLARHYEEVEKDYNLMKMYYLIGIEKGDLFSMNCLACHYEEVEHNYDLMKDYHLPFFPF
jgi:hypothetical protein